jgi:hypothetical protein
VEAVFIPHLYIFQKFQNNMSEDQPELKKRRVESGDEGVPQLRKKNIVEIQGKSCLHEVAWPPGASRIVIGMLAWRFIFKSLCISNSWSNSHLNRSSIH